MFFDRSGTGAIIMGRDNRLDGYPGTPLKRTQRGDLATGLQAT
jgi:hypothetical protein